MTNTRTDKIGRIIICPSCRFGSLARRARRLVCTVCDREYNQQGEAPVLIPAASRFADRCASATVDGEPKPRDRGGSLSTLARALQVPDRVWSVRSQRIVRHTLAQIAPDKPDSVAVLIGAGIEPVYQALCRPYRDIIRVGLPHAGRVDIGCDACFLPLRDGSVDLVFSSSVLEHVYDPERAVAEMYRVLKPGGRVYAEIPFLRAYHMAPIDYQRYTISGINELFRRHGFETVDRGICSGPFTASALFVKDFWASAFSFNRYCRAAAILFLGLILHPLKYMDRLFEDAEWAQVTACNFYFLGRKRRRPR